MRVHGWPESLDAYIESRRQEPFEYGKHDCCHFAGGAVEAVTGSNPMKSFDYRNRLGAERLLRSAGTLDALVNRALGEPVHPAQARRGDVVIADLEYGATVGVCLGEWCAFAAESLGVTFRPRTAIRAAWRIE